MKLIVDENIPQCNEAFGKFGETVLVNGRRIDSEILKDADFLIVRSITKVNESLLKNSKIKFVGTATIGTDHVDTNYLESNKIEFADAAGCNAYSVAEYVLCAITKYCIKNNKKIDDLSIGVIGHGNVGSKVARFAKALGMQVIVNDPPLQRQNTQLDFKSLDEALSCDVITFHVPLNLTGTDKTYYLLNDDHINNIKGGSLLINSSRGPVINNSALLQRLTAKNDLFTVLDVWEHEPKLISELHDKVDIGTPHIAGYSYEGKINGTKIIHDKLADFLNVTSDWKPNYPAIEFDTFDFNSTNSFEVEFNSLTKRIYDIEQDNVDLKKSLELPDQERPLYFDQLRKKYPIRREFNNYKVRVNPANTEVQKKLESLRFNII